MLRLQHLPLAGWNRPTVLVAAAQVAVTLWNTGEDAFRPDVYGQFITVQRKVGSGASYQTSGERGNIVSRSRDEMLAIVDHLSIDAGASCRRFVLHVMQAICAVCTAGSKTFCSRATHAWWLLLCAAANPIAVMTQDTSRDFLAGTGESADRKKHELFMQVCKKPLVSSQNVAA